MAVLYQRLCFSYLGLSTLEVSLCLPGTGRSSLVVATATTLVAANSIHTLFYSLSRIGMFHEELVVL